MHTNSKITKNQTYQLYVISFKAHLIGLTALNYMLSTSTRNKIIILHVHVNYSIKAHFPAIAIASELDLVLLLLLSLDEFVV